MRTTISSLLLGFVLVFSLLSFSPSAAAKNNQTITLEDMVLTRNVNQVTTTTDGQYTAFTLVQPRNPLQEKDGSAYTELYMITPEGKTIPFITGKVNIQQIQFSADNQTLYYLAQRGSEKTISLYSISVHGGESHLVFTHQTSILSFDLQEQGHYIAFRALKEQAQDSQERREHGFVSYAYEEEIRTPQLFVYHVKEKHIQHVEYPYTVHSALFRPGTEQLLVRAAPTAHIDDNLMLSYYTLIDLQGKELLRVRTSGKLGQAAFSPDGSRLAVIGAENEHDPATGRLYLADLRSGRTTNLVPQFLGHTQGVHWLNNQELLWHAVVGSRSRLVKHQVQQDVQEVLFNDGDYNVLSFGQVTQQGSFTFIANTTHHANEAFLYQNNQVTRLTDSNPWIHQVDKPKTEVVSYKARDGLTLEGILVYPTQYRKGKRYPLILVIHGGPESLIRYGWNNRYANPAWYWAEQGYAVFFPNYRGSTGRGVEFSKLSQNDYAGKEFDDIVDAKEHFVRTGLADKERIGITGGSYGGYASAWGATKQTEHFAASVMFVGVSDLISKFGTTDIPNEMFLVHARSNPWDKWLWYLERSPIYWAEQSRTPLLIMHGENDTRVHPSQSMELYRYLKIHGNAPVRLVFYPGEGHGNSRAASQLDFAYRLTEWMDWYLMQKKEGMPEHRIDYSFEKK